MNEDNQAAADHKLDPRQEDDGATIPAGVEAISTDAEAPPIDAEATPTDVEAATAESEEETPAQPLNREERRKQRFKHGARPPYDRRRR